jgi:hypothetical protein
MKLSLDAILQRCPRKLLALYPLIVERIQLYNDTPEYLWDNLEPLIILIPGSRNSGKSEWAQRASIAGIYDGYVSTIKYATMTENGLNGSKDAFERLAPECRGTGANVSKREPMHRVIGNGRVDFDFFGKNDIKNEQKKYDILICEEVEKWDKIQGVAALETEVRHCKVILLISNNPPTSVVDFCKTHDAMTVRVDWWDNVALPAHIRAAYEKAKVESPVYYSRFIMCQNDTDMAPWFDNTGVENFFSRKARDITDREKESNQILLSIDVGGGYGDESVIAKITKTPFGSLLVEILGKYQLETPALAVRVNQARAQTGATEEVWDASGIGYTAVQQRAPDPRTRRALGVVSFMGNNPAITDETIFNARSEAYALWQKMVNNNQCWYVGNEAYIDQIRREMFAQVYAEAQQSKGMLRIAEKKDIKKNLNGESPNMADAIAMGVWRAMTYTPKQTTTDYQMAHGGVRPIEQKHKWF